MRQILFVTRPIVALARRMIERRLRAAFICSAIGSVLVMLLAGLATRALDAQAPLALTNIFVDARGAAIATITSGAAPAFHPSRVLVRFRNGAPAEYLPGSPSASDFPGQPNLHLVQNPPGLSVAEVVRRYQANPNVLYAEPDYKVQAVDNPTDPDWTQQWDMVKIAAPTAWASQKDASDVVVAVVDTGIDLTHPDLQGNLWPADNKPRGFTCIGGGCVAGGVDDFGHGTHVAGTIGAAANNGIGIAGINWRIQLLSVKFLGSDGSGLISDAVLAFDQITTLKQQGVNIRVTNNSWGGGGFSQSLKEAMAQNEAQGILHVCAAGNSNLNADVLPMYPAAYDNGGIISVLASDKNDAGASFTNYGLASVDIAAPGVSTLSTVPTGACTLCDKTGYRLLSGTSMATPHVSGVLAALFHRNPSLSANEARDVVLDPGSYDQLKDSKAKTTSTGGRLNFAKALANPRLSVPKLNHFPTLTMGSDVFTALTGPQVSLTAKAADGDNDPLRMSWARSATESQWLLGWMLNSLLPSAGGSSLSFSFTAPTVDRTATAAYDLSVADGRGGSAQGRNYVTLAPSSQQLLGKPPTGSLSVSPADAPVGSPITVSFPVTDPEKGRVGWDLWVGTKYAATGNCCFTGSSTTITMNSAGVYRIGTQAIDQALNLSTRPSLVVRIGGATGEPPIARATLDKLSGPVPLTVNIDMSASNDPDGSNIPTYLFGCVEGSLTRSRKPQGSCTFTTPGTYWIQLLVQDNSGYVDQISAYVVATPGP